MIRSVVLLAAFFAAACSLAENAEIIHIKGKGKVAFVNAAGVDDALLRKAADGVGKILMLETEIQKGEWSLPTARESFARTGASVAIFVINDRSLPMSLIAMEEKWGVANAAILSGDQITKEAVRVAAIVLGGASSKYPVSALRPAFSPEDLDKVGTMLTIDSLMAILPALNSFGLSQYKDISYFSALSQGNAPPPANEAQRKIKAEFEEMVRKAKKSN